MSLFNKILKKEKKETEAFELPDFFEITEDDIKEYMFMITSKSYTSPLELEKKGYIIDNEISKYKKTEKYKILSTKLKCLDFKNIYVKQVPYIENDIDTILGLKSNSFQTSLYMPSLGACIQLSLINEDAGNIPLGNYISTFMSSFIEPINIRYKKGKSLELDYKLHYLMGENNNSNEEVTYLESIKKRNVKSLIDYCKIEDKERDNNYSVLSSISDTKVIIQNLYLKNDELMEIENLIKEHDNFKDLIDILYEKYNLRICSISKINDIYIIKGNDRKNIIYTTLPYNEWTNGLKACSQIKEEKNMNNEATKIINLLKADELYTKEEMFKMNREKLESTDKKENKTTQFSDVDFKSLGYDSYEEYYEHEHFFGNQDVKSKKLKI